MFKFFIVKRVFESYYIKNTFFEQEDFNKRMSAMFKEGFSGYFAGFEYVYVQYVQYSV